MFHEFISEVIENIVTPVIQFFFTNDLISYFFYFGILGILITLFKFIISLNNNDLGRRK